MFSGARLGDSAAMRIAASAAGSSPAQLREVRRPGERRQVETQAEHLVGGLLRLVVPPELDQRVDDDGVRGVEARRQRDRLRGRSRGRRRTDACRAGGRRSRRGPARRPVPAAGRCRRLSRPGRTGSGRRSRGCAGGGRTRGRVAMSRRRVWRRWRPRGPRCGRRSGMSVAWERAAESRRPSVPPWPAAGGEAAATAVDDVLGGAEPAGGAQAATVSRRARGRSRPRVRTTIPLIRGATPRG